MTMPPQTSVSQPRGDVGRPPFSIQSVTSGTATSA